jgi:hypothetical protein
MNILRIAFGVFSGLVLLVLVAGAAFSKRADERASAALHAGAHR